MRYFIIKYFLTLEKIEELSNDIRRGLKDFCINECRSFCCRKGYLILKKEELDLIAGSEKKISELIESDCVKEMWNGKFSLNFDVCKGCPSLDLKNFKCKIHENPLRPNTCKDFPIFVVGNEIKISSRCPAKQVGKFFKFEKEAERLGYKIVEEFS